MVARERQPVLPGLEVSSSNKGSACSFEPPAGPVALLDILQMAPRLLQSLCPKTMATLASTSKQLHCLVHGYVTSVSIIQHNGHGTPYQITELQVLTNGNWPRLQRLNIKYRAKLEMAAIRQLSKASWSSLTSLDLSRNSLSTDAISQLVLGKWPALKRLNLSCNRLDSAAIALLTQAEWPLEELQLSDNRIGVEAMEELIQGRWPKLSQLTLRWNKLNSQTVAILAEANWPLRYLDLGQNPLDANAMAHLGRGRWPNLATLIWAGNCLAPAETIGELCKAAWPHLVSLNLSKVLLSGAEIAGLCNAYWPKLSMVDLAGNCLDEVSMMYLVKADWPELKHLDLSENFLDDAALEILAHNSWHKLERLVLRLNDYLTQNATSFLSIEQQRVVVVEAHLQCVGTDLVL